MNFSAKVDSADLYRTLQVGWFEGKLRLRVTGLLATLFSLFGAMYIWVGPEFVGAESVQQMLDAMPRVLTELLGFESIGSLEALLAGEFYTFAWIIGFGGYIAYTAAVAVASGVETKRMDTLLAGPVARWSVLLGTYGALLVPISLINLVVPVALYTGSVLVGDPLRVSDLLMVHILSIPYLLVWGAIGLLLGVLVDAGRRAGRIAIGLVFASWVFETVISLSDAAWLGGLSPVRYFQPPAILVDGSYDFLGAAILLMGAFVLVTAAEMWFARHDL